MSSDPKGLAMMDEDSPHNLVCFSPLPSRRWEGGGGGGAVAVSFCELCPSMDLVLLKTSNTIQLHRTVTNQRVASVPIENVVTHAAWSPDGRFVAWTDRSTQNQLSLRPTEDLLRAEQQSTTVEIEGGGGGSVLGLLWAHVGNPHPSWPLTQQEKDQALFWKLRSHFVDKEDVLWKDKQQEKSSGPTSKTPLSLVYVATQDGIQVYIHGRSHILTIIPNNNSMHIMPSTIHTATDMVASSTLNHLIVHPRNHNRITIVSCPELVHQCYALQSLTATSCALQQSLDGLVLQYDEVATGWRNSLKPMNMKLDQLIKILYTNYSLTDSLSTYLIQFIVSHQVTEVTHAMEQFLTSPMLNDQLLQRMERSLMVAVANIEAQVQSTIVRPAQSAVLRAETLVGLARAQEGGLVEERVLELYEQCCELYQTAELAWSSILQARFRLRDLCSWLRSAASQAKASGTAANSVQRQNAQQRRVNDAVTARMLQYLQTRELGQVGASTEVVLGLHFSTLLHEKVQLDKDSDSSRSSSPQSVRSLSSKLRSLPEITANVQRSLAEAIQGPRQAMQLSVHSAEIELPEAEFVTTTVRMGFGNSDIEDGSCFGPREDAVALASDVQAFREWCVVAAADKALVTLHAMPLTWTGATGLAATYAWTTKLVLPDNYVICKAAFYGDDGKSSLSSGWDSGTGKERRQALVLFVRQMERYELWSVSYDNCVFTRVPLPEKDSGVFCVLESTSPTEYSIQPMPVSYDDSNNEVPSGVLYARTRPCSPDGGGSDSQLLVSGSRGVGALVATVGTTTTLSLWDLEENEEVDEEEDGHEGNEDEVPGSDDEKMSTD